MKMIPVREAVGHVLCHDITQIIPGGFKGRRFAKGHIITEEDIPVLLSLGKDNIYVWEMNENMVHENDAAVFLKDIAMGSGLTYSEIKEGKITFTAAQDGLLKVDTDLLYQLNLLGQICFATLRADSMIRKGQAAGAARIIPLAIEKEKLESARRLLNGRKIISVQPLRRLRVGIVTTGNEVYYHRIEDGFGPVLQQKLRYYGCEDAGQIMVPDDQDEIVEAITSWLDQGADAVFCTGGMSVDPDDRTPAAIRQSGCRIVSYGSPVLPGAMFLLAYSRDGRPVLGLPGCVMHSKNTVFDLVFPRILAGEELTREDLARYGNGGYCMNCEECRFPNCQFGKY